MSPGSSKRFLLDTREQPWTSFQGSLGRYIADTLSLVVLIYSSAVDVVSSNL